MTTSIHVHDTYTYIHAVQSMGSLSEIDFLVDIFLVLHRLHFLRGGATASHNSLMNM